MRLFIFLINHFHLIIRFRTESNVNHLSVGSITHIPYNWTTIMSLKSIYKSYYFLPLICNQRWYIPRQLNELRFLLSDCHRSLSQIIKLASHVILFAQWNKSIHNIDVNSEQVIGGIPAYLHLKMEVHHTSGDPKNRKVVNSTP